MDIFAKQKRFEILLVQGHFIMILFNIRQFQFKIGPYDQNELILIYT